ncbi:MAG: carbohydrate-binding protein [Lachnospiraceae bacterium]|nr:carbohydrate-binding protein [Lachnospiraceae bacterium]
MLCIKILDENGRTLAVSRGEKEVNLVSTREYREGDMIQIESSEKPGYLWLQLDDALGKSLVYFVEDMQYKIPFGKGRINLSPKVFSGNKHLISVKTAKNFEIKAYRNLAMNVNDHHGNKSCFPHASANVETRGEAVFAAKNAIDGVTANQSHGEWPYVSWGINRNPDAQMKLDFGREVEVDRLIVYIRADFPHDNWWKRICVSFSDGENMELSLKKTAEAQEFTFEKKRISWLKISHMIPSDEPSPFPALSQIEVYGYDD